MQHLLYVTCTTITSFSIAGLNQVVNFTTVVQQLSGKVNESENINITQLSKWIDILMIAFNEPQEAQLCV